MNTRKNAARKAARTARNRRAFVAQFGDATLHALRKIVNGRPALTNSEARTLAAYKANLTRGTYSPFVSVNKDGTVRSVINLR
jgi:hypothetical protein